MEINYEALRKAFEKNIIRKEGCWGWKGFIDEDGYGRMSCRRQNGTQILHRASYLINKGPIPKGYIVRHTCHNKICANPDHLELGTSKQNSRDMVKARRQAFGTKNGNAKLTEEDVRVIKRMIHRKKSYSLIAELFDVHADAISNIAREITWKHVNLEGEPNVQS